MKKLPTLILCAFLATTSIYAAETSDKTSTPLFKEVLKLTKEGKLSEAMTQVNSMLAQDPKNTNALRARGNIFFAENKFEEAYKDFDAIVELAPKSARAYFDRGIAGFTVGNDVKAVEDIDHALSMNPKLAKSLEAAPKLLEKMDELRNGSSSVGAVRLKKGTVSTKKGTVSIKEKGSSK